MSAFDTFLSSLYNCLLKSISLIISLAEVRNFIEEVLKISGEVQSNAHHPAPPPKIRPLISNNVWMAYAISSFYYIHLSSSRYIG